MGKSSNTVPFALRDPFELDSSAPSLVPPLNPTALHRSHHQNELFRFDAPRRHAHQLGQQFPMSMNNSPGGNSSVYSNHKLNPNSSAYPPFSMHHDRLSSTPPSSSTSSLSSSLYSFCHYPSAPELTLPTPVSPISTYGSSLSLVPPHPLGASSRKIKVNIVQKEKSLRNKLNRNMMPCLFFLSVQCIHGKQNRNRMELSCFFFSSRKTGDLIWFFWAEQWTLSYNNFLFN